MAVGVGLLASGGTVSAIAGAASALDQGTSRALHLVNAHTWEKLDIVYYTHGVYIDESVEQINHLMRDHRVNKATHMDPVLLDQLLRLSQSLNTSERIHVLSGYRTPETNAKLRKRSSGVAKYSLHMEGKAADIYVPGIETQQLQLAALDLKAGGVGYYPKSNFVHMDTGMIRQWGG